MSGIGNGGVISEGVYGNVQDYEDLGFFSFGPYESAPDLVSCLPPDPEATLMTSPQAAVNGPRRRKRTKYNSWQKNLLEKAYSVCKYPNVWTRETLSKALNVDDARIIVRSSQAFRVTMAVREHHGLG
eukprot:g18780.t1